MLTNKWIKIKKKKSQAFSFSLRIQSLSVLHSVTKQPRRDNTGFQAQASGTSLATQGFSEPLPRAAYHLPVEKKACRGIGQRPQSASTDTVAARAEGTSAMNIHQMSVSVNEEQTVTSQGLRNRQCDRLKLLL